MTAMIEARLARLLDIAVLLPDPNSLDRPGRSTHSQDVLIRVRTNVIRVIGAKCPTTSKFGLSKR
jgi:hypothetical protein